MHALYLSIGTNLGNRQSQLDSAVTLIGRYIGVVEAASRSIETEPWGFESSNKFLNMAVKVRTELSPQEALSAAIQIEKELGRSTKTGTDGYKDRSIDIDLLIYDAIVIETPTLTLPHSLMHKRRFVLEPLSEIAPDLVHPVLHKTISELLDNLEE